MIVISQILDWKPGPSLYESSFQVWLASEVTVNLISWMDGYIYIYRVIRCSSYIRGCKHKSWHHMAPSLSVSETTDAQNLLAISGSPFWES